MQGQVLDLVVPPSWILLSSFFKGNLILEQRDHETTLADWPGPRNGHL